MLDYIIRLNNVLFIQIVDILFEHIGHEKVKINI